MEEMDKGGTMAGSPVIGDRQTNLRAFQERKRIWSYFLSRGGESTRTAQSVGRGLHQQWSRAE